MSAGPRAFPSVVKLVQDAVVLGAMSVMVGCTSEQSPERPASEGTVGPSSSGARPAPGSGEARTRTRAGQEHVSATSQAASSAQSARPGDRGAGAKLITTPGGVVVSTPSPPRTTRTVGTTSCSRVRLARSGPDAKANAPPIPGISARRINARALEVKWNFARNPEACRAVRLKVTVDVTADTAAGKRVFAGVHGPEGRLRLALPPDLSEADALRVNSLDSRGLQSRSSSVAVR